VKEEVLTTTVEETQEVDMVEETTEVVINHLIEILQS
jgi:hypothetical protein